VKVLVTGATGFIGSHLADALTKSGLTVKALVRDPGRLRWLGDINGVEVCRGSLESTDSLAEAVRDVEIIYHTAGMITARNEKEYFDVNAAGTENLLDAAERSARSLERFVLVSSLAAAGPGRPDAPLDESASPRPITPYGRSKLAGEEIALKRSSRLPVTIVRPPAVYGPRDAGVFTFFKLASLGIIPIPGFGRRMVSLAYVEDLVQGILKAGTHPLATGKTYFITSGDHEWDEVARALKSAVGKGVIVRLPVALLYAAALLNEAAGRMTGTARTLNIHKARELKQRAWLCSSRRAMDELGYNPGFTLEKGMKITAEWYRKAGWIKE